MKFFTLILVVGLGLFVAATSLAEPATDTALQNAHQELRADRSYQFAFTKPPIPPEPPKWLEPLSAFFAWISPALKWVFWGGVILILGGFALLIFREISKTRFGLKNKKLETKKPVLQMTQPGAEAAKILLEQADQLAKDGKFGEAVHLLLLRSIQDIEKHLPGAIRRSQTSREIELLDTIPPHPRSGFERIRQAVENSFFGTQSLGQPQYMSCRQAYEDFAFSPEWA